MSKRNRVLGEVKIVQVAGTEDIWAVRFTHKNNPKAWYKAYTRSEDEIGAFAKFLKEQDYGS